MNCRSTNCDRVNNRDVVSVLAGEGEGNRDWGVGKDQRPSKHHTSMSKNKGTTTLSPAERQELLATLEARFKKNRSRHEGVAWEEVRARLEAHPDGLRSLHDMERTGGEPDVVGRDAATGAFIF